MKNAIVTGGTSGIGLGVAKMLVYKGYNVYVTYVGKDFTENIENLKAFEVDHTNRDDLYGFIDFIKNEPENLDDYFTDFYSNYFADGWQKAR